MIVYPNAKINIGLNVIKKRPDSYHDISSVFYPVKDLFDILEIIPSDSFSFSSSGVFIPDGPNLCTEAYNLFKSEFQIQPVKIHLHKKIPVGSGLGGGSSDGAFTLVLLNKLFFLGLSDNQLEKYALQLGADCPFFIQNQPKYVTGLGEKMRSCNIDLSNYDVRFIFPDLHISTVESYSQINPRVPAENLLDLIENSLDDWKGKVKNDFEEFAFLKYNYLQKMKDKLYTDGAIYASMTGTGSALYGIFEK